MLRRNAPLLALLCLGAACDDVPAERGSSEDAARQDGGGTCTGKLFGSPSQSTGLDPTVCSPECTCNGRRHRAPAFDETRLAALGSWTLLDAPVVPDVDPYSAPAPPPPAQGTVCAVQIVDATVSTYRLSTFESTTAAEASGAIVTHGGACGLCSSLGDLAVYAGTPDLTAPVRACGVEGLGSGVEATEACLAALGFSAPCARIWAYNVTHTRERCLEPCLELLDAPYHLPDGGLNACLRCDEVESGPVFKAVAGRTRRNTGIASALCRPCVEVLPLDHVYE